jgi:hypothetical protein
MHWYKKFSFLILGVFISGLIQADSASSSLSISSITQSAAIVPLYEKLEITFDIDGTVAENLQWPYDPDEISGLPTKVGITVDGVFLPPGETD